MVEEPGGIEMKDIFTLNEIEKSKTKQMHILTNNPIQLSMVANIFNPNSEEAEAGEFLQVQHWLVYIVSSRPSKPTEWDPTKKKDETS